MKISYSEQWSIQELAKEPGMKLVEIDLKSYELEEELSNMS